MRKVLYVPLDDRVQLSISLAAVADDGKGWSFYEPPYGMDGISKKRPADQGKNLGMAV